MNHDYDINDIHNNYIKILIHKMIAQLYMMFYKKL